MGRLWTVAIGLVTAVVVGALILVNVSSPTSDTDSASPLTKVAFYGDSYTLGTGASELPKRWSTIISTERNWDEFNPSINGLGFINNRMKFVTGDLPDRIIKAEPDIVFITMGLNDNFSYDFAGDAIHDQIDDDFARLAEALPSAHFIAVEPFWYTDERPDSIAVISGWVQAAAADIGADYIAGASHWIEGHPEYMAADGLHPNDLGYAEMARRMDDALDQLGI